MPKEKVAVVSPRGRHGRENLARAKALKILPGILTAEKRFLQFFKISLPAR